jgi:D-alanyl-D-alanine carboxypeptidase
MAGHDPVTRRTPRLALLIVGAVLVVRAAGADAKLASLEAKACALLEDFKSRDSFPGAAAAFALPDGRVGEAAVGSADPQRGIPMTARSRFLSGSTGKTFVAALTLALAREGRVDLDAPISRWLGGEPWFERLPNAHRIHLRHLLQHSAGLEDHVFEPAFLLWASWRRLSGGADAFLAPRELVEIVLDQGPRFAPGTGHHYTDTGYILVGMILERATGRSYEDLLSERFLHPLRLADTQPADGRELRDLAAGHQTHVPLLPSRVVDAEGRLRFDPRVEWTGGGLISRPFDLARWAAALYDGGAMPGSYLDELVGAPVRVREGVGYGLGVYVYEVTPLGPALGHGGWFPGYSTQLIYYREPRLAVAVQSNSDAAQPREYAQAIAAALMDAMRARSSREARP